MNNFIIAKDVFDNESWESIFSKENPVEFLQSYYDKFPANAKIYHNVVSLATDVTPNTEDDIDTLSKLEGVFFVMEYPGDPVTVVIAIVAIVAVAAVAFLLQPKIPAVATQGGQSSNLVSPNNGSLSARQNNARLNARISDIYGTVRSIPDLITLPYTFFDSASSEYELSLMCVGVGEYDISDVKEGDGLVSEIYGESVKFYDPNQSPNTGVTKLLIGDDFTDLLFAYRSHGSVNGQVLVAPNASSVASATRNILFAKRGTQYFILCNTPDIYNAFAVGDTVTVASTTNSAINSNYVVDGKFNSLVRTLSAAGTVLTRWYGIRVTNSVYSGFTTYGYIAAGTYTESGVAGTTITVTANTYSHAYNAAGYSHNISLVKVGVDKTIGPFTITDTSATNLSVNLIASSGLYNCGTVVIKTTITKISTGAQTIVNTNLTAGNYSTQKGFTVNVDITGLTPCTITFNRTTNLISGTGAGNDEIRIRDLYYGKQITQSHFGNVTTAYVKTKKEYGTSGLTQDRKFNCLVTRKLNTPAGFVGTNDAGEIVINMCLDPKIGRRQSSEIDLVGIRSTVAAIKAYFGNASYNNAGVFNYTFDNTGISFEETIVSVASAIHCIAYRQDGLIKLKFERDNSLTTLLFNHRNTLPGTQQIAYSFGTVNDYDGVSIKYIDPSTDQETILYIPTSSVSNPKEVEFVGIRDKAQAYYLGWRAWNKLKYQNMAVDFNATQESDLITLTDRILVAPINRTEIQQGEIVVHSGLQLTLSVDVTVANGDTIFLQYYDGTTGTLTINSQVSSNVITVTSAPALALVVDLNAYVRTEFVISRVGSLINLPYIVTNKERGDKFTNNIKAVNYDSRYYDNDHTNPATI